MKRKILIAPNSYKESADSVTAANLFYSFLKDADADFIISPLTDGGDGFLKVMQFNKNLKLISYEISAPWKYFDELSANDKITVSIGLDEDQKVIYIESADVLGMKIIPLAKRKPLMLTSEGLGELLLHISRDISDGKINADKLIIGIGGTGTADAGMGFLSATGLKLFNSTGKSLSVIPSNFRHAVSAEFSKPKYPFTIDLIIDVNNPLLGVNGGIKVYSEQKGAGIQDISVIEEGIKKILNILPLSITSGAGGGLPAGFSLIPNVNNIFSSDFIKQELKLHQLIDQSDLIITGEGKYDKQSSFNKAVSSVLAYEKNKPIYLCCGIIEGEINESNIIPFQLKDFFKTEHESITHIEQGIKAACRIISSEIF